MSHAEQYLSEVSAIASSIDSVEVEKMVSELVALRYRKGRLFIIGLGGSAANASHAVNDFRKLCGIEAYAPTDNVAELTARANDEGWHTALDGCLHFATSNDALMVLSVGGGKDNVSLPILNALAGAEDKRMRIYGIVGRDGGETANLGHCVIIIPTVEPSRVTPHTEAFQSVIWHCLVSHPDLQQRPTKW